MLIIVFGKLACNCCQKISVTAQSDRQLHLNCFHACPETGNHVRETHLDSPPPERRGRARSPRADDRAVSELHLTGRPLVVSSPTPHDVAGKQVVAQFEDEGYDPSEIVIEEASFDAVQQVIDHASDIDAGFLLGVGGGKAIDITKMAADDLGLGFVSVPTAASHDGIVSGRGSVPEGDTRHSVAAEPPLAVIADTEVLAEAPCG